MFNLPSPLPRFSSKQNSIEAFNMFEAIRLASNRRQGILATIITLTLTSTISVILRLVSKLINRDRLMREDYVVLVAQVHLTPR